MGAVVLISGGCHQLERKCSLFGCHRNVPQYDPNRVIVNAGYSETHWIPLAPTFESTGYVEHFADDVPEIPLPIAREDVPATPREGVIQTSAQSPIEPPPQTSDPAPQTSAPAPQTSDPAPIPVHPRAPELVRPKSPRALNPVRPVSVNTVEDAQLLLDFIRS